MDVRWHAENKVTIYSMLFFSTNKCTRGSKPFHFLPKMLWPIKISQLCTVKSHCCRAYLFFVRMSLVGEREMSWQRMWRHFPGRVTKETQQGKHINVCAVSLGIVQNTTVNMQPLHVGAINMINRQTSRSIWDQARGEDKCNEHWGK